MQRSSGPRKTAANLSDSIQHHLNLYALAAGAAEVATLALAQPAQAKIVYTSAHITIPCCNPLPLDLNHDGINDLSFTWNYTTIGSALRLTGTQPNHVVGQSGFASALKAGAPVGPKRKFVNVSFALMFANSNGKYVGQWQNVKNRYLGVKFLIKGKTHYGWVRLNVKHTPPIGIDALITGYAFETIAGKPIIAGKTMGPDQRSQEGFSTGASVLSPAPETPQPASLGMLALGAHGVPLWRRKESVDRRPENS
jgi:hypothetical protein